VLHTDTSLLPRRRTAWSSWNFHLAAEPRAGSTVTYWMNNLQRLRAEREYLVTLNRGDEIDPEKVLRRFEYDHPVYTTAGVAAQARHAEISGVRRTHYCGAYWGWGFHEDGVVSALRACEGIGGASGASTTPAAPAIHPDPDVSELSRHIEGSSSDTPGSGEEAIAA
jgi:predicted NAD/FAD-binding protein